MVPNLRKSDSFLPSFFGNLFQDDFPARFFEGKMPAINVVENKKEFRIDVAAPGLEKGDFKIKVDNNTLLISAEKTVRNEEKDEEDKFLRREFGYTSFSRSFVLPDGIETEKITANQKDGVIEIKLPKKESAKENKVKEIEIK